MTAVYQAGSSGRAGGTGTAAPRLRRAASTIIAMALSRIWPSSAAVASGSQVPAAMSWSRWSRQNVLSRSAMTTSPSRAGVTPLSIQLAACGQVTSPCRVNPGPLTVISMPRASQTADEPAPGRCESRSPSAGGVPAWLSHSAKPGRRRSSVARSLLVSGDAPGSGLPESAGLSGAGRFPVSGAAAAGTWLAEGEADAAAAACGAGAACAVSCVAVSSPVGRPGAAVAVCWACAAVLVPGCRRPASAPTRLPAVSGSCPAALGLAVFPGPAGARPGASGDAVSGAGPALGRAARPGARGG